MLRIGTSFSRIKFYNKTFFLNCNSKIPEILFVNRYFISHEKSYFNHNYMYRFLA